MRICVIHSPTGLIGGDKTLSYQIVKALDNLGHDIVYYTEDSPKDMKERISYDPSESVEFRDLSKPLSSKLLGIFETATLLRKALNNRKVANLVEEKSEKFEKIIVTHKLFESGKDFSCETLQYVHGLPPKLENRGNSLYDKIVFSIFSPELANTDSKIFNSEFTANKWGINDERAVLHPYPPGEFKEEKWENKKDRAVIVARIAPDKNIKEAIEISKKYNIPLDIIGLLENKEHFQELQRISDDRIEFFPNADRDLLKEKIADAKIGLNCKEYEQFGIAVAEYLKSGTAPLVRSPSGSEEVVAYEDFIYENVEDAGNKIEVLLGGGLEAKIKERQKAFTPIKFREKLSELISTNSS